MISRYRPTTLRLASRHCPRAVDFYDEGRPYFREHYAAGIAAHAVLEALGRAAVQERPASEQEAVVAAVCHQLTTQGRVFDGQPEPPLPQDAVMEGRDLALAWAAEHPLSATAHYELGAGFATRPTWRHVGYGSPEARFRLILDVLDVVEEVDEETSCWGLLVRDYKSAWSTDAAELDTIQMRAQACAAWAMGTGIGNPLRLSAEVPALHFVRQEIVNLRTGQIFSRTLWMHAGGEGQELLAAWRRDLEQTMDTLDAMGRPRPARPGAGCMGCPWVIPCEPAQAFAEQALGGAEDERAVAQAFAVADAIRSALFDLAKAATEEAAVDIGGAVVGSVGLAGREPAPEAALLLLERWQAGGGDARGLMKAIGHRLGLKAIEAAARALYSAREDAPQRDAIVESLTRPVVRPRFGVHRE